MAKFKVLEVGTAYAGKFGSKVPVVLADELGDMSKKNFDEKDVTFKAGQLIECTPMMFEGRPCLKFIAVITESLIATLKTAVGDIKNLKTALAAL